MKLVLKSTILFLISLLPNILLSQQPSKVLWEKLYQYGDSGIFDVCSTKDGGLVCLGRKKSNNTIASAWGNLPAYKSWLVKYDLNGKVDWEFDFGKDFFAITPYNILSTKNGEFIVTAGTYSSMVNLATVADLSIYRLNYTGSVLWDTTLRAGVFNTSSRILEDFNGNIIALGLLGNPMIMFTKNGEMVSKDNWPFGNPDNDASAKCPKCNFPGSSVMPTFNIAMNGGYLIGDACNHKHLNENGNLHWCNKMEKFETDGVLHQFSSKDGGVITLWKGKNEFARVIISKTTENGVIEWITPIEGQWGEMPSKLFEDSENRYIVTGIYSGLVVVKADGSITKTNCVLPYQTNERIYQSSDGNFFLLLKEEDKKGSRLRKINRGELKSISENKYISFEPNAIDFGILKKGDKTKMELKVTNISKKPISLFQKSSCGCMMSSYKTPTSDPTLKPNESRIIVVQVATNTVYKKSVSLKILLNTPESQEFVVPVKFEVIE